MPLFARADGADYRHHTARTGRVVARQHDHRLVWQLIAGMLRIKRTCAFRIASTAASGPPIRAKRNEFSRLCRAGLMILRCGRATWTSTSTPIHRRFISRWRDHCGSNHGSPDCWVFWLSTLVVSFRSYSVHRWNNALRELNVALEQRVTRRTADLEDTNQELEAFAYSVSHDLRAPLRAMEGFAIALEEDYGNELDEQGREFVRHIADSASRMDVLIRDLLDYSRLGRADLTILPTNLNDVVQAALGELASDMTAAGAVVTVAESLPTVLGHRTTLIQVAVNLIGNAIKFVRPDVRPVIQIWSESTESC